MDAPMARHHFKGLGYSNRLVVDSPLDEVSFGKFSNSKLIFRGFGS